MIYEPHQFKATVSKINLTRYNDPSNAIISGTIDCIPDMPRMPLRNVRLIAPIFSQTFSFGTVAQSKQSNNYLLPIVNTGVAVSLAQAGFWHMPNIGDIGVVGFLNGYADYGVWYGSLMPSVDPRINPPGNPPGSFQRQDAIWFHETGSFIRFRNKAVYDSNKSGTTNVNGTPFTRWTWDGITLIPDITIQHGSGTNLNITQIIENTTPPTPTNPPQVQLTLTHVSNGKSQQILTVDPNENMTWNVLGNIILSTITNPNRIAVNEDGTIVAADAFSNSITMNSSGITVVTNGTSNSITFSSGASGANITNNGPGPLIITASGNVYLNTTPTTTPTHPVTLADLLASLFNTHTHGGVLSGPGVTSPPVSPITAAQIGSTTVFSG